MHPRKPGEGVNHNHDVLTLARLLAGGIKKLIGNADVMSIAFIRRRSVYLSRDATLEIGDLFRSLIDQ
jgi:hypothetical protein